MTVSKVASIKEALSRLARGTGRAVDFDTSATGAEGVTVRLLSITMDAPSGSLMIVERNSPFTQTFAEEACAS